MHVLVGDDVILADCTGSGAGDRKVLSDFVDVIFIR